MASPACLKIYAAGALVGGVYIIGAGLPFGAFIGALVRRMTRSTALDTRHS